MKKTTVIHVATSNGPTRFSMATTEKNTKNTKYDIWKSEKIWKL